VDLAEAEDRRFTQTSAIKLDLIAGGAAELPQSLVVGRQTEIHP